MKNFIKSLIPSFLWSQLRILRQNFIKNTYPKRIVEHNYCGHRLKIAIADPLANGWYDNDWPILNEIKELKKSKLQNGALVFDCGAHQSVVATILAKEVAPKGKVIAVEAMRHNYLIGKENVKNNQVENLEIIHNALGDKKGKVFISENFNSNIETDTSGIGKEAVDIITLNQMVERYGSPDVVFLDIEGAESLALKSASSVLNSSADWFIEVHGEKALNSFGSSTKEILSYFPSSKFKLKASLKDDQEFIDINFDSEIPKEYLNRFFLIASKI